MTSYRDLPSERAAEPVVFNNYEAAIPQQRLRAKIALGLASAVAYLPGLSRAYRASDSLWSFALFIALFAVTMTVGLLAMRWSERRAAKTDFFLQHLEQDTRALLEPPRLRVGVDVGVPAEDAEPAEDVRSSSSYR
jgi:hypothetical protein